MQFPVTINHDALDLTVQGPGLLLLVTYGGQDCRHVQNCSLEDLIVPPPPTGADIWWLATEACIVGERAVRILLECFLVN